MLVEDDPDVQIVASMSLTDIGGFEVLVCGSGAEALEAAPRFSPDLILMDVMMPGGDGPSIVPKLLAVPETCKTPVVFLTARVQPADLARYREVGCLDVIPKPFDPSALPDLLKAIWARQDE
jgi:CheY-like chemotaxis protein